MHGNYTRYLMHQRQENQRAAVTRWNTAFDTEAVRLSPAHAGRINWLVVAYYRDTLALTPEKAAARYVENEAPINPIPGRQA